MPDRPDLPSSHLKAPPLQALRRALEQAGSAHAGARLEPLPDKGLAHDHVRLAGTGLLARIPKQSQLGLPPEANLAYQRACFERAGPGGHAPRLAAVLQPSAPLPRGALLVEEIQGRPAGLPQDLPRIGTALARLHGLPLPHPDHRAPLLAPGDPLAALHDEVVAQAACLPGAGVAPAVLSAARAELDRFAACVRSPARPPSALVAFDAHPGNFLIDSSGRAVLVDLEKCRYGLPGCDLAHASLYTSTTWDRASAAVLTVAEVAGFHAAWEEAAGPGVAGPARPWHVPLRRAMWLWSLTWCAKWRTLADVLPDAAARGEDWSAERSDASLVAHVRERVAHYLSIEVVERVRDEFDTLDRLLAP